MVQAIYSIFKTESEQVDDLRMVINVSLALTCACKSVIININCVVA